MKVFVVDAGRDASYLYDIDIQDGKFVKRHTIKGSIREQSYELTELIIENNPYKVIFDTVGISIGLKESVNYLLEFRGFTLHFDGGITRK